MTIAAKKEIVKNLDPSKVYYCIYDITGTLYKINRDGIYDVPVGMKGGRTATVNSADIDYTRLKSITLQLELCSDKNGMDCGNLDIAGFTDSEINSIYIKNYGYTIHGEEDNKSCNEYDINGCWVLKSESGESCWSYVDEKEHTLQHLSLDGDDNIEYGGVLGGMTADGMYAVTYNPDIGIEAFKEQIAGIGLKLLYRIATSDLETIKSHIRSI